MAEWAGKTAELVERARRVFERHPEIVAGYLFGSLAHGRAGPLSDVDLAVHRSADFRVAESGWQTYRGDLHAELVHELGLRDDQVDLVVLEEITSSLLAHRATWGGRLIFCRDERVRVKLDARILLEYLDAAPLRRLIAESVGMRSPR